MAGVLKEMKYSDLTKNLFGKTTASVKISCIDGWWLNGWMDEWMDEWMDGSWIDGHIDRQMDGWIDR